MTSVDIVYDKIHFRHDPKWSGRLGQPDRGVLLCVACVIEMMESHDVASVRKSVALSGISGVLKCCPGALSELLQQDQRVCLHFTASLLGTLRSVEDPATLDLSTQVLVQLLLELQSEQYVCYVLNEIHTQLSEVSSERGFLPTCTFLGKLADAVPSLPQSLASQHVPLLERLCSVLLCPGEALRASALYVWQRVWEAPAAARSLPAGLRERVCSALLRTLAHACSPQLTINCLGLLRQLLKVGEVVSVLMNCSSDQILSDLDQNQNQNQNQNQEGSSSPERCPLPLILKKLLLSGDETLQVASAQCMAAVLVHSTSQYCAPFILADVPEFLFERLNSNSEVLLWSVYSCLLLLTEDALFFSHCHAVYGIESLVRSLKVSLRLTNLDVQRQGLLLLTEILERQPVGVRLFPSSPGFVSVSEAVLGGVASSCLQVATQAACAATALLRLNHQSIPVQYGVLEKLVEAVVVRCTELPLPSSHRRTSGSLKPAEPSSQASRGGGFLLQALVCFQAACSLAEQCASEPGLKENAFTAPGKGKQSQGQACLESLCQCLLRCCDTVCIPTVTRQCERVPSAQVLQYFFSILSCQFTLLPSLMPLFSDKLASSGFYRLALEHKALLCAGNRNPGLNAACSAFLQQLSVCLLSQLAPQQDAEEAACALRSGLPSLCVRVSEWPSLLCGAPGPQSDPAGPWATQYCLVILLHLALQYGDRLLPDCTVFSCVARLLCSVQEQGDGPLPASVLRSALYLLAVTQDRSPDLDWAPLNCIIKALSFSPSFSSLYTHHPPLLHFIYRYPDLADRFGLRVLELWLTHRAQDTPTAPAQTKTDGERQGEKKSETQSDQDPDSAALLAVMEKSPSVILTLLGVVCSREGPLAERALAVLGGFLQGRRGCDASLSALLTPTLLQVLQRLSLVEPGQGGGSLSLVLRLLCLLQTSRAASADDDVDGTHFKLLYYVSNLAGKMKPTNPEALLPALSYLQCCLSLSAPHCVERAVSMLLSNTGIMDQLQALLSSSPSPSSSSLSPSLSPSSALLSCARLLLSSLVTLQKTHSAQVHRRITLSLEGVVLTLLCRKRHTDALLLASSLRLLQVLLDVKLSSELVSVSAGPEAGPRPLGDTDSCLYPLGSRGALCLASALYGLLLQKQELVLGVSVNCLGSLLAFLQARSPDTVQHVMCQPWCRLLLYSLLNSGDSCLLHPATLTLLTLLLRFGSRMVLWEPDLRQVLEAVERRGLERLGEHTAQAVRVLFTQLQSAVLHPPPSEQQRRRADSLMESLVSQPPTQHSSLTTSILLVGELSICLSDFAVRLMNTSTGR